MPLTHQDHRSPRQVHLFVRVGSRCPIEQPASNATTTAKTSLRIQYKLP